MTRSRSATGRRWGQAHRALPGVLCACVLAASGAARAFDSEYFRLRASAGTRYDNNVFRVPDGVETTAPDGSRGRSDTIRTLGAGASLLLPVSRQRFSFSYDVNDSHYAKFTDLDSQGDDQRALWQWEFGRLATGSAGLARSKSQADFADSLGRRLNLVTSTQRFFDIGYPFHANWRVGGGVNRTESTNSDPLNQVSDSVTESGNVYLRYVAGSGDFVGVQASRSDVDFPNPTVILGIPVDNGYTQESYGVSAGYATGGASNLNLSLNRTRRTPNEPFRDETTGWTGNLAFNWTPTGRTALSLAAARDFAPAENVNTSSSVTDTLQFAVSWIATGKVVLRGNASREEREFTLTPGPLAIILPQRRDVTSTAGVTATYTALRWLTFTLSAQYQERDSNVPGEDYDATTVAATAQVAF